MKALSILAIIVVLHFSLFAQNANVVQLEHSLRWLTESNFPNFLDDPETEAELISNISHALKQKLHVNQIEIPDHFSYRLISYFGKSKIKIPKSKSPDYMVGIASAITRGTTNYKVLWQMNVKIVQNNKVVLEKEIEHELEPYSISIRLGNRPWLNAQKFIDVFMTLLDESLGLKVYEPGTLTLGSYEMVREDIAERMPIGKEYTLAVVGDMMGDVRSSYKLLYDSIIINEFYFNPTDQIDINFNISGSRVLAELFNEITGIDTYYNFKSREKRTGTISDQNGTKRKVRLDWLEEIQESTSEYDESVSRIISPVTGRYFDKDSLIAEFMFYQEIQKMKEFNKNTLHDMHFQMGDDDLMESLYAIVGRFNGNKFEVVYREMDQLVFIRIESELAAVLSLINTNPDSRSSGGLKLSKNKATVTTSQKLLGTPEVEISTAEWYPLYTLKNVENDTATEMGYFLLLLFFSVSHMQ